MISNTERAHKIPNNNLKVPPISSSSFTIFSSDIGSIIAADKLYTIVNTPNFITGTIHIPIIIIIPTIPTAFFKITPHPRTESTASPNILPTTGIMFDTAAFAVFAVIPSILLLKVPSNYKTPTNRFSTIPKNHVILVLKNLVIFDICTFSEILETIDNTAIININGIRTF